MTNSLEEIRHGIDAIDDALLTLLHARQRLVLCLATEKLRMSLPVRHPEREAAILLRLQTAARTRGVNADLVAHIFRLIIDDAVRQQERIVLG